MVVAFPWMRTHRQVKEVNWIAKTTLLSPPPYILWSPYGDFLFVVDTDIHRTLTPPRAATNDLIRNDVKYRSAVPGLLLTRDRPTVNGSEW